LASISTVVWSNTAGFICEATKRCQISFVNLEFVFMQIFLDLIGMARRRSRANGFVRGLRFFFSLYVLGESGK